MAGRKLGVPMRRAGMRSDADWQVCQRMRDRRAGLGLTQQQMAELIGVTSQQAHKYETGISRISAGRLYRIAEALGVEISNTDEARSAAAEIISAIPMGARRGTLSSPPGLYSRCPLRSQPGQRVLHPLLMGAPRDSPRPSQQLHPLPAAFAGRLGAGDHGIQLGEPFGRCHAVIQFLCPPGLVCAAGKGLLQAGSVDGDRARLPYPGGYRPQIVLSSRSVRYRVNIRLKRE